MKNTMKKLFCLALVLTFLAAACMPATLSGCQADAAREPRSQEKFTGLWHSMNMVAAGFAERYAFYEDGTFIYGSSQMDALERELYKTGTWSVADGELRLTIEARLTLEGGQVEEFDGEQYIDGAEVRERLCSPPESEIYKIAITGPDDETDRETISIDGVTYYRFDNQTDLMDGYYELKGIE